MHALDLDGMLRRLHLPTVRRLYPECAQRAEAEDQSYRDFLATLIAEEVAHRAQTRIERSVRKARFPFLRTIEDFDFTFQTSVRLQLLGSYLGPELVTEGRNLVLCGPSGTGKTHLAIAIAYRAIQNGYEALFTSAAGMIEDLSTATRRGGLARTLADYTHPPALVIDEVGYLTVGGDAANLMFQVVNERYLHRRPMLFTNNKPLAAWGLVLHDPDLAEAILDRVLERGRLVELRGASYRTRHLKAVDHRSATPEVVRISGDQRSDFPEPTPVHLHAFAGGQDVEAPVAPAWPRTGQRPESLTQSVIVALALVVAHRAVQANQTQRSALADPGVLQYSRNGLAPGRDRHESFPRSSFSSCTSSAWLATSFFSRAFSSSNCLRRFASLKPSPPYLAFHLQYVFSEMPCRQTTSFTEPAWASRRIWMICSVVKRLLRIGPPCRSRLPEE